MTNYQKKVNQRFFEKMIEFLGENCIYFWPQELEFYTVHSGCFVGTKKAINKIKGITPIEFHNRLRIK
jgi:hypothetical protein